VHTCRHCGSGVEDRFRYCPWCAVPQRRKLVEFFAPHPGLPGDARKALRVTRYFGDEDSADAAVSLTEEEAERVAAFIEPPRLRRPLLEQLRESLRF
jgi:hypothetical protein